MEAWMSLEETAKYLQIGKTVLYDLSRKGNIPSNRVGAKWLFSKNDLDNWVRSNKTIERFFSDTPAYIEENHQLRETQIEAYQALYDFFRKGGKTAVIQIPVGCGKSGIAAIAPFGIARGRVLVVSPNLTIKEGLVEILDVTNRQKCFCLKRNVLKAKGMVGGPFVCTLDTGNKSVCKKSHIVVSSVHQFATNPEKWLKKFPQDFFDLIIVDEAHYSSASSWKTVVEYFKDAKIINMTATPFRSDKKEIEGKLVYRYPFKKATFNGYIKRIKASYVAPSELEFTAMGKSITYTLDEVLDMKEEDWFSRGIALSDVCNQSIVDNSLEKLEELRKTGTHHQLIAVACSVFHAENISNMYIARGFNSDVIYCQQDEEKKQDIKRRLTSGELDCIVQVQMLGEGFDCQKLSVAAIFRPFRTLAPYIQFVGSILRVIIQNNPSHPDNYGHVVTHSGMNLDERLREFKLFENDDQKFWDSVIGGVEPELPKEVISGETRIRLSESAVANYEIVESLIEEDFLSAEDVGLIRELEETLESLGLDPSNARAIVLSKKNQRKMSVAEPYQISPQSEWKQLSDELQQTVNKAAKLLLNRLNIPHSGRDLIDLGGVSAVNNFVACVTLINKEIKAKHPANINDWSNKEFRKVYDEVEGIINNLTRTWKGLL